MPGGPTALAASPRRIRLEAQDTALSRRRSPVRIRYAVPRHHPAARSTCAVRSQCPGPRARWTTSPTSSPLADSFLTPPREWVFGPAPRNATSPTCVPGRASLTEQLIYSGRAAGWLVVPRLEPGQVGTGDPGTLSGRARSSLTDGCWFASEPAHSRCADLPGSPTKMERCVEISPHSVGSGHQVATDWVEHAARSRPSREYR
jgi:hypothetical protein